MPADPARAQEVFLAATERTDPVARSAYLDQACAGDAPLRARVEALLRAHDQPDSLLDAPLAASGDPDSTQAFPPAGTDRGDGPRDTHGEDVDDELADALGVLAPPGRPDSLGRIGHYEVLEVLGRGGFGVVFRAFDDVLQRVVAVKVLAPSLAVTSPARKRFLREARASAPIQHENVVRVYEVGEQPLPYLVMEFIPGETLQQMLDRTGPLEVADVVRIGRQIALGLAAAHEQGLIHRDIKPSNILIDNGPREHVKLTDFGLARAADDASLTRSGVVAGTPMYMAPEQARGESLDHRADLFSLGSVLYTMLTGHPPFRAESTLAVLKRVAEDTPRPIREVIPEVPAWLCRIVEKLHTKDPAARYQTAAEVADVLADCEQQLKTGGRVEEPAPAAPRRRRRRLLAAAALTLMVLVAGGLGLTEATGITDLKGTVVRLFTPSGTLVVEVDDPQVKVTIDGEDLVIHGAGVQELWLKAGTYKLRAVKDGQAIREELVTITRNGKQVVRVSREPRDVTGKGSSDSPEKERSLTPFATLESEKVITSVALSPDEKTLAVGSSDGEVLLYEVAGRRQRKALRGHKVEVRSVAFSPDGNKLLTGAGDWRKPGTPGEVKVWDVATGKENRSLAWETGPVFAVAWSADQKIAAAGESGAIKLWSAKDAAELPFQGGHPAAVPDLTFSPDGRLLATASADHTVRLWNLAAGKLAGTLKGHEDEIDRVRFSPDGKLVATGSRDRTIKLWDPQTCKERATLRGHGNWVHSLAFSAGGDVLFAGDNAHQAKAWDVVSGKPLADLTIPGKKTGGMIALAPRSKVLVTAHPFGTISYWDVTSLHPNTQLESDRGSWVPLFNGKDLTGWVPRGCAPGTWKVENGVLVGRGERYGELVTERGTFQDYELRLEARINAGGDSGVFNRANLDQGGSGYEVQIGCHEPPRPHTGAVGDERKNQHEVRARMTRPGEWFTLEITLRDNRIVTRVNGSIMVDYVDPERRRRQGHIVLQLLQDTVVEFRKIEIKELRKAGAGEQPFVLLGGGEERAYATLSEAIAGAADGDTIEVRGNGPFITDPIVVGKGLIIRAGAGWRPVIRLSPKGVAAQECLLTTDDALTLEGLELQWLGQKARKGEPTGKLVHAYNPHSPLSIANCRFVLQGGLNAVTTDSRAIICRNSEFICPAGGGGVDWLPPAKGRMVMDNCINVTQGGNLFHYDRHDFKDVSVHLTRNTFIGLWNLVVFLHKPEVDSAVRPIRVTAEGNVFHATGAVWNVNDPRDRAGVAPAPQGETALRRLVAWQGHHNLFPDAPTLVNVPGSDQLPKGVRKLSDWERFWGNREPGSLQGKVRYKNGDVVARAYADPRQVSPEDFRLHRESPGKGAAEGGKDLGADVDLVGPGTAYERWRKSPEYQKWLQATGK